MKIIHEHLLETSPGYRKWHDHPHHSYYHFFILIGFALIVGATLTVAIHVSLAKDLVPAKAIVAKDNNQKVHGYTSELLKAIKKYEKLPESQKAGSLNSISALIATRNAALVGEMSKNAKAAQALLLPPGLVKKLPPEIAFLLEHEETVTGQIVIDETHDFVRGTYEEQLSITTDDDNDYQLFLADQKDLTAGARVKIKGTIVEGAILAGESQDVVELSGAITSSPTMPKKVAVVIFNFSNDTRIPLTNDAAKTTMFSQTSSSANKWHLENSYGQVSIVGKADVNGDVFGPYTIPNTNDATYCNSNSNSSLSYKAPTDWGTAARNAATAAGHDMSGYDVIVHVFPTVSGCSWGGFAKSSSINGVTTRYNWINGGSNYTVRILSHELGHVFKPHHAGTYRCKDNAGIATAISTSCVHDTYGDMFDTMGGASGTYRQMSAIHKYQMGVLPLAQIKTISTSGTYTLLPIEHDNVINNAYQGIRIPRTKTTSSTGVTSVLDYYDIEYRQPYGYDNFLATDPVANGVTIRISPCTTAVTCIADSNSANNSGKTLLIDTTPTTSVFTDAALTAGKTFSDTAKGITIRTVSVSTTSAVVDIQMPNTPVCTSGQPNVSMSPITQTGTSGTKLSYSVSITNTDTSPCSSDTFSITRSIPSGWSSTLSASSISIAPGSTGKITLDVTSASSATDGSYPVNVSINGAKTGHSGQLAGSYVVYNPIVVPPPTGTTTPPTATTTPPTATTTPSVADTTAPTVTFLAPANGLTVNRNVNISVKASDNIGVVKIQLYVDNNLVTSSTTSTLTYTWNSKKASRGQHVLKAVAYDAAGNTGTTQITVNK